jgi:ATP-dependent DNA ligase
MLLSDVAEASCTVAATASRNAKIGILAALLERTPPATAATAVSWLMGETRQGRIGVGPAAVRQALTAPAAAATTLTLGDVDAVFDRIAALGGAGSTAARVAALRGLFERATDAEQDFLARLLWGELRQGALGGAAGRRGSARGVQRTVVPAAATHARATGRRHRRRNAAVGPGRARLQAGRRARAGAQGGRSGACVHAPAHCLYADGQSLLDEPARQRFAIMRELLPARAIVPRLITADAQDAAAFLHAARTAGHEGIVAKALDAAYEAGRRGAAWLKVKQADTLDLVVLAAEWGSGRRTAWLSNLHLGARDADGGFIMLGKTFKGLTDALLEWQTRELLAREIDREGNIVHVRPELVVEIAFEGVQASSRYPGGVALRFARVKGYRPDKTAEEADTIERVRLLHRG